MILGLDRKPSRQEAKKVFHRLAKIHHPDNFARDNARAGQEEDRMKQINLAFHFLLPRLSSDEQESQDRETGQPPKTGTSSGTSFFSEIFRAFGKGSRKKREPKASGPARQGKNNGISNPQGQAKTSRPDFDQVFSKACQGPGPAGQERTGKRFTVRGKKASSPAGSKIMGQTPSRSPYANFMKHMALKNRIRSRTRLRDPGEPGIVEKIDPIRRVTPVGRREG